jgi:hypothetical protein
LGAASAAEVGDVACGVDAVTSDPLRVITRGSSHPCTRHRRDASQIHCVVMFSFNSFVVSCPPLVVLYCWGKNPSSNCNCCRVMAGSFVGSAAKVGTLGTDCHPWKCGADPLHSLVFVASSRAFVLGGGTRAPLLGCSSSRTVVAGTITLEGEGRSASP